MELEHARPDGFTDEQWERFEAWADQNWIGSDIRDVEPWALCWLDGWNAGCREGHATGYESHGF